MRKVLIALIFFTLLIGAWLGFWFLSIYPQQSSDLNKSIEVTIKRGSGAAAISNKLAKAGIVKYPLAFRLLAEVNGVASRFQAGEYMFNGDETTIQVMDKLTSGDIILRKVTIAEGKTSAEVVEILNKASELKGSIDKIPDEGSLLPNTYRYVKGETRQSIIDRMQKSRTDILDKLWDSKVDGLPFKTKEQALILASIVEKETGVAHERAKVAGLYINRLHKGMLLQADPTVSYGIHGGQSGVRPLTYRDLRKNTPYNTYMNIGLPPTPICNPGKEAIAAVINPEKTDYLYMVATGTGGHYFAKTNQQHLLNVKKYRKWQRQQKSKR